MADQLILLPAAEGWDSRCGVITTHLTASAAATAFRSSCLRSRMSAGLLLASNMKRADHESIFGSRAMVPDEFWWMLG